MIKLIILAGIFALFFLSAQRSKKNGEKAKAGKNSAGHFVRTGREAAGRLSEAVKTADPDMVKRIRSEVTRTAEAFERSSYSFRTPEQKRADRHAGHADMEDSGLQDEKHDWLARQLEEERKSYREVSEMFQMKMSHLNSCAAENNRLEHSLNCAARQLADDSRNI